MIPRATCSKEQHTYSTKYMFVSRLYLVADLSFSEGLPVAYAHFFQTYRSDSELQKSAFRAFLSKSSRRNRYSGNWHACVTAVWITKSRFIGSFSASPEGGFTLPQPKKWMTDGWLCTNCIRHIIFQSTCSWTSLRKTRFSSFQSDFCMRHFKFSHGIFFSGASGTSAVGLSAVPPLTGYIRRKNFVFTSPVLFQNWFRFAPERLTPLLQSLSQIQFQTMPAKKIRIPESAVIAIPQFPLMAYLFFSIFL